MKHTLTAKEEELMNIFWKKGEMCIRDLVNSLPEPRPSYTTVSTQVSFLESKGFLSRRPVANTFIYKVRISEKNIEARLSAASLRDITTTLSPVWSRNSLRMRNSTSRS